MNKYIIFGANGFIGTHLSSYLRAFDSHAKVFTTDICGSVSAMVDVRQPIHLSAEFNHAAILFNLAAIHKTPGHPDKDYFHTNILGAENVCDFARRHQIRTIVFTSSIAPYGAAEELKSEDSIPMPNTPYGISKLVAEKIHLAWMNEHPDNRLVIVRPGIVFGHHEGGNFTRLYKALKKGMFAYAGRKDTVKAAIYVKDLVRLFVEMANNQHQRYQLYNCCYEPSYTIEQIVHAVKAVTGIRKAVPKIPARALTAGAKALGAFNSLGLGIHPDRVRKLMVSTNISGAKLSKDYQLQYNLEQAIQDWWNDCDGKGLE